MKIVYLVRHAEAISEDVGVEDFKRMLSPRGVQQAQIMSSRLRHKGIAPDLFIASPADRALETAHLFADQLEYPIHRILLHEAIYATQDSPLPAILRALPEIYQSVIIFGHDPALTECASVLMHDADIELRPAGVVGISLDLTAWQDLAPDSGTLLFFDFPISLTPKIYKKARKALRQEIAATMQALLEDIDADASQHVEKILRKTSKKLAKEVTKVLQASKIEELAGLTSQKPDHNPQTPRTSDASAPSDEKT
jgi:phosphohistidine phosphatase